MIQEKQRTDAFLPVGQKGSEGVLSPALEPLIPSTADQQTCLPVKISPGRLEEIAASSSAQITKQIYKEYEESRKHNITEETNL